MFTCVSEEGPKFVKKEVSAIASRRIEDELAHIVSQIAKEEEEYLAEQNIQKQVISILCVLERYMPNVLLENNLIMIKWSENHAGSAGAD